jgi:hypothetical protein
MKRAAKLTRHASYQYNINRTMRYEIEFFAASSSLIQASNGKHLLPI